MGHSLERQMRASVLDTNSCNTRFNTNSDGSVTRLRTRGGMCEYVTEQLPVSYDHNPKVFMDSGAIDIVSTYDVANPNGVLYYSTEQQAAAAVPRLLGYIAPPGITSIPDAPISGDPAISFLTPYDGSGQRTFTGDLSAKKFCIARCPASMFTGKARLYVQAQYGRKLGRWDWALGNGVQPSLVYKDGTEITTNTGVYRDPNYTHWLMTVHQSGVRAVKLARTSAVEPLITLLKAGGDMATLDYIEAYVLSQSIPSSTIVELPLSIPQMSMLGYGWKFNWSGTAADIIQHNEGDIHTSTHYRLRISRNNAKNTSLSSEASNWVVTSETIEGPVQWHSSMYTRVISYPLWSLSVLYTFGTLWGGDFGDAPIYCFYERDTLLTFRFTATGGEALTEYKRESSPSYWGLACPWTTDALAAPTNASLLDNTTTVFTEGGYREAVARYNKVMNSGFYGGGAASIGENQYLELQRQELGSKTISSLGEFGGYSTYYANDGRRYNTTITVTPGTYIFSDGVVGTYADVATTDYNESYTGAYTFYTVSFITQAVLNGLKEESGTEVKTSMALLIVPFYDAEAVYSYGEQTTTRTTTGWYGDETTSSSSWAQHIIYSELNDPGPGAHPVGEYWAPRIGDNSFRIPTVRTYFTDRVETTTDIIDASLITPFCKIPFSPPPEISVFFYAPPVVSQQFFTTSSTRGLVYGHGAAELKGIPDTFSSRFVGWA